MRGPRPVRSSLAFRSPPFRTLHVLIVVALGLGIAAGAPAASEQAGTALLFAKGSGDLSQAQQQEIFQTLGLRAEGSQLVDEVCGQPAGGEVELRDLNGDGVVEVFVTYGNTCLSGMAGSSFALFVRDASSHYRANFRFPGLLAEVMTPTSHGYPDLLIGGPGFCFAVWRWNGKEYAHLRNEPQAPGGCDEVNP